MQIGFKLVFKPSIWPNKDVCIQELDACTSKFGLVNNRSCSHCPLERCNRSKMWRSTHTHGRCAQMFERNRMVLPEPPNVQISRWVLGTGAFLSRPALCGGGKFRRKWLAPFVEYHLLARGSRFDTGQSHMRWEKVERVFFHVTFWPMKRARAPFRSGYICRYGRTLEHLPPLQT